VISALATGMVPVVSVMFPRRWRSGKVRRRHFDGSRGVGIGVECQYSGYRDVSGRGCGQRLLILRAQRHSVNMTQFWVMSVLPRTPPTTTLAGTVSRFVVPWTRVSTITVHVLAVLEPPVPRPPQPASNRSLLPPAKWRRKAILLMALRNSRGHRREDKLYSAGNEAPQPEAVKRCQRGRKLVPVPGI